MEDMSKLKEFIERKITIYGYIDDFSVDDLKELHYLTRLALIEKLCCEAGEIFSDILKEGKQ